MLRARVPAKPTGPDRVLGPAGRCTDRTWESKGSGPAGRKLQQAPATVWSEKLCPSGRNETGIVTFQSTYSASALAGCVRLEPLLGATQCPELTPIYLVTKILITL